MPSRLTAFVCSLGPPLLCGGVATLAGIVCVSVGQYAGRGASWPWAPLFWFPALLYLGLVASAVYRTLRRNDRAGGDGVLLIGGLYLTASSPAYLDLCDLSLPLPARVAALVFLTVPALVARRYLRRLFRGDKQEALRGFVVLILTYVALSVVLVTFGPAFAYALDAERVN